MRIYLAGMTQTGFASEGKDTTENVALTEELRRSYPWALESYHYIGGNPRIAAYLREHKRSIFLDSGAFTMFTQGATIDHGRYADFINANCDWIHVASNIDEIGRGKERESYDNQKRLERAVTTIPLCPVHHARDDDKWLAKYLSDGYDYIFLGGMVAESTPFLRGWLDHVWQKFLTNKDGSARVKVHGFGLTTLPLIRRYPWFSVDSTRWVLISRYGMVFVDLPHKDVMVTISESSPQIHTLGKHYDHFSPLEQKTITDRIIELGYDPALLRTHYGWRDHFNIEFFRRAMDRPEPHFIRREETLF